jgi:hypothetical protein
LGQLILKRASASRPSGEWNDDYDVLADGVVVRRIMKAGAVPVGQSWMWTLAFGYHEDRTPTHGFAPTATPRWPRYGCLRQLDWPRPNLTYVNVSAASRGILDRRARRKTHARRQSRKQGVAG